MHIKIQKQNFLPLQKSDHSHKQQNTECPTYDAFYSKDPSCDAVQADYNKYVNLLIFGMTREQAAIKLKLSK